MNNTSHLLVNDTLLDDPYDEREISSNFSLEIFLKYVFTTAKILSDITIIYTTRNFRILKTWENCLIMHWASVDLAHVLIYFFYTIALMHTEIIRLAPCLVNAIVSTTFLSSMIFAEGILVGFVLLNAKCSILKNYESLFKKFYVTSIYIQCFLESIIEYCTCWYKYWFDNLLLTTHVIIAVSFVLNIILKKILKYDGHVIQTYYLLHVSNAAIFSLIPLSLYHYLLRCTTCYEWIRQFFVNTLFLAYLILLSNSVIVLVILYRYCRDFRTVMVLIFRKILMHTGVSWNELQQDV